MKVCMFVYNNMKHDSRVIKEAKTLVEAGYDVRVIAVLDKTTRPYEERDGFRIIRVVKKPIHYKIVKVYKGIFLLSRWILSFLCRPIIKLMGGLINRLKRIFPGIKAHIDDKEMSGYNKDMTIARFIHSFIYSVLFRLVYYTCYLPWRIWCWCIRHIKRVTTLLCAKLKRSLMIFHRFFSFLDYYRRSLKLVKKEPADIYHAHDLNTLPLGYWARKKLGGRLVYDSHELYTETSWISSSEKFFSKIVEGYLIRRVNRVITVNRSIANELLERYKVQLPIVIMNCPKIDNRKMAQRNNLLRQKLGLSGEISLILYQGGYAPNRGLKNLIMSAHYLSKEVIVLMGWGKLEKELRDLTKTEGLGEKVRFTEPVPQKDLLDYTSSATLGIIPYRFVGLNNYYTSPNKLFEYIAVGLPAVGSNFPELKRIIEEYDMGMTFNPDDPKSIAEAINCVLSDKEKYDEMKRNALRAAKVFNWENESKKLLGIYTRFEDELNIASN